MAYAEKFSDKVIIVTGASAGIGAALAKALVVYGAKVVGLARRKERLDTLAKQLEGKPGKLYPLKTDLTKENEILEAFKWTAENVGPIDILINNAGTLRSDTLINGSTESWKIAIDTNLMAVAICCREAIRIMQSNDINGQIININSTAGHYLLNVPLLNMYPASKHALTTYTEGLRRELAGVNSKIRVSSMSPGEVSTEIGVVSGLATEEMLKQIPDGQILDCEDVVQAVVFMLTTSPTAHVTELILRPLGERA